jgi:hypothetical protein
MALVGHGDSNQSQSFPDILGWNLWSRLHYIPVISRGLQEFKSIFTKKFPEKNFHSKRLHMNERIKQFVKESHLDVYGLGKDRVKWESTVERFSEMLLQECMSICEEMGDKGMDGHYCVDKIRREFGV